MTSKLKCSFCGEELDTKNYYVHCHNPYCNTTTEMEGTEDMWQALMQAKQDLEIARKALESISGVRGNIEDYYGGVSIHYQQMVLHMDEIATNALEQINHIADVSKMVWQN